MNSNTDMLQLGLKGLATLEFVDFHYVIFIGELTFHKIIRGQSILS